MTPVTTRSRSPGSAARSRSPLGDSLVGSPTEHHTRVTPHHSVESSLSWTSGSVNALALADAVRKKALVEGVQTAIASDASAASAAATTARAALAVQTEREEVRECIGVAAPFSLASPGSRSVTDEEVNSWIEQAAQKDAKRASESSGSCSKSVTPTRSSRPSSQLSPRTRLNSKQDGIAGADATHERHTVLLVDEDDFSRTIVAMLLDTVRSHRGAPPILCAHFGRHALTRLGFEPPLFSRPPQGNKCGSRRGCAERRRPRPCDLPALQRA